jgi:hypothetical protein
MESNIKGNIKKRRSYSSFKYNRSWKNS